MSNTCELCEKLAYYMALANSYGKRLGDCFNCKMDCYNAGRTDFDPQPCEYFSVFEVNHAKE